jgi:ligand-binding sensor domain-containing protein
VRNPQHISSCRVLLLCSCCALLLLLLSAGVGRAQTGTWAAVTSMRPVNALTVVDGVVFGATSGGVLRYDPSRRKYTRFTRVDGLSGNRVLSVSLDPTGDLWFGTDGAGLSSLRPSEGRFANPLRALDGLRINAVIGLDDRVLVGTDIGISVLLTAHGRVKETYRQLGGLSRDTEVHALAIHRGSLWAATAEGIAHASLDDANLQDPDRWVSSRDMGATSSLLVHSDTLFGGGAAAAWRYDEDRAGWRPIGPLGKVDGLGSFGGPPKLVAVVRGQLQERQSDGTWVQRNVAGQVHSLTRGQEQLWLGTDTGLAVLGSANPPRIRDTPNNQFFDIELGPAGQLWVASMANDREGEPAGIYRYDGSGWEVFGRAAGLSSDFAVSVVRDEIGRPWVATWGRGVSILGDDGVWNHLDQSNSVLRGITQPSDPRFVVVSDIQRDAAGLMWMTNVQAGLAVMGTESPRRGLLHGLAALGLPPGADLSRVAIGPNQMKWVATPREGFVLFDDGGTPFTPGDDAAFAVNTSSEPRLRSNNVTTIAVSPANVLWVGTDNGLYRLTVDYDRAAGRLAFSHWREYRLEHGLNSSFITAVTFDDQGNVWVGSRVGLTWLRATGGLVTTFTTGTSGLIDDRIESLKYDAATGSLWIGTFGGLSRLQVSVDRGATADERRARIYPNPLVIGGKGAPRLTIAGLPLDSVVRLFSMEGGLIRTLEAEPGATVILWDGTNRDGDTVGTGIFLCVATTKDGRSIRSKFAVVRAG